MDDYYTGIFSKRAHPASGQTKFSIQSPLSSNEDKHLESVRENKHSDIISYKGRHSERRVRIKYANTTDTFFFLVSEVIQCIEDKKLNAFDLWVEFKNQEKQKTKKNTLGVNVKVDSYYYHVLLELEKKVNNNDFSIKILYVSEYVRFVIYISKKYCFKKYNNGKLS